MAELDDSIGHLRAFVAILQAAQAAVEEATASVDEQSGDLGRLVSTADEGMGSFVEALEGLSSALQESQDEATAQVDRVGAEAERTAGERLDETSRVIADEEAELANTVQVGRDDLDKDATGLATGGFEHLISAAGTVQGEVDNARQTTEASFQTFDGAVLDAQQDAGNGIGDGGQAFDAGAAGFGDQGTQLATQAAASEADLQGRAGELEAECATHGGTATASYAAHAEAVAAAADDLITSVAGLGDDNAAFVTTSSADQIDAPVSLLMADAVPPLITELEQLDSMLAEGDQTTAETDALCSELERCQRAVESIDQMLDAMQ